MTQEHKKKQRRLAKATVDSLNIIGSLLRSYESGDTLLYIPIAAQLRVLLFDKIKKREHSLLGRLEPNLRLRALRSIQSQPSGGPLLIGFMPFEITKAANGIILADFELSHPPTFLPLDEWREQVVTLLPRSLTVNQIIRSVCDKGGGAHFDDDDGIELSAMKGSGPTKGGIQIPFTIAVARYVLEVCDAMLRNEGSRWGIESWTFRPPDTSNRGHWDWEVEVQKGNRLDPI